MASSFTKNFILIKQWQVQKHKELKKILEMEAAGGFCMILFALIALILFNSPFSDWYSFFIEQDVLIGFGKYIVAKDLKYFTGNVLLVFFFAVISMELKRDFEQEILEQKKQILLPMFAAIGGILCPALIYTLFNLHNPETIKGWAVPCSTDTAFAIAVLLLLGKSLPRSIKVFMLATTIFDDLWSIIIITLFYSSEIQILPLIGVCFGGLFLYFLNKVNIVEKLPYLITATILFFLLHYAGISTIISGVMLGFAIPLGDNDNVEKYPLKELLEEFRPFVSFFILPLFAFVNAGVQVLGLTHSDIVNTVTLGAFFGLFIGKQIGIFGTVYLFVKFKLFKMPKNLNFNNGGNRLYYEHIYN